MFGRSTFRFVKLMKRKCSYSLEVRPNTIVVQTNLGTRLGKKESLRDFNECFSKEPAMREFRCEILTLISLGIIPEPEHMCFATPALQISPLFRPRNLNLGLTGK